MLTTRLHLLCEKITSIENTTLTLIPNTFGASSFNTNILFRVEGVTARTKTIGNYQNLIVVSSYPCRNENNNPQKNINATIEAENLVITKKIASDFNHIYLYRGSDGSLISQFTPHSDLFNFFLTPGVATNYALSEVKDFTAQILLATYSYHSKNLVHRDIKPENFLVFDIGNKKILKLADHEDTIDVTTQGKPIKPVMFIVGSDYHKSPELVTVTSEGLSTLNYKAIDCYAVGVTLRRFYEAALIPTEYAVYRQFYYNGNAINVTHNPYGYLAEITRGLTHHYPPKRLTITQALKSRLFGDSPASIERYLNTIKSTAKSKLQVDCFNVVYSVDKLNSAFYLLPADVKQIYLSGKYLVQEIAKLTPQFVTFNHTIYSTKRFKEIKLSANKHNKLWVNLNRANFSSNLQQALLDFETELEAEIGRLSQLFYGNLSRSIQLVIEESVKNYRQNMIDAQGKGLGEAGRFTFFQRLNFSFADELTAKISAETPYQESFKLIHDAIGKDKGFSEHSFKAVLMKNLLKVLHENLSQFREEAEGLSHINKKRRIAR